MPHECNFYVSAWNTPFKGCGKGGEEDEEKIMGYLTQPLGETGGKAAKHVYNAEEITDRYGGKLLLKGEVLVLGETPRPILQKEVKV